MLNQGLGLLPIRRTLNRSGDEHAVGDVTNIVFGDVFEPVTTATLVKRLQLSKLS